MQEVDIDDMAESFADLIFAIINSVFFVVIDKVTWAIWNTIVDFLSVGHLGESAAMVVLTLGILFCIWLYVFKFMV